jgi:glycosyltransferase involved in cell wall biosynthesis
VKPGKVLIITYYWPPGGGAGVQRWLKFVKYLPGYGWQPVVYTPENGEMPVADASLEKDIPQGTEVIRKPIWEPYNAYKKFIGAAKHEKINTGFLTERKKPGLAEKISVWLRGNLFIPDARCYWIRPSVKFLLAYLREYPVEAIVSTGPPHSMHLIALEVSKKTGIPWLADFRDPWTRIDYYKDLMLTGWADRKHHRLEQAVVKGATRVVVVGNTMKQEFEADHGRGVDVITNGYDDSDVSARTVAREEKFVLAHVGTLVRSRNPSALWQSLASLTASDPGFAASLQIRLTGKVDIAVKDSIEKAGLQRYVTYIDYLPHDQVIAEQQRASVLLLILNDTPNARGILTGKLFEYLAARRPILCIGPTDGDAAAIIRETQSGKTCNFTDIKGISEAISASFTQFKSGSLLQSGSGVEKYSRKALTGKLVNILNDMTST